MKEQFTGYKLACSFFVCLAALLLTAAVAVAQSSGTAALTGTVTDLSGASLANVTVTATNIGTNQQRTMTTGPDGIYKFALLPPGNYRVQFSAKGFKTTEVPAVTIEVTETATVNRVLEVGTRHRVSHGAGRRRGASDRKFHGRRDGYRAVNYSTFPPPAVTTPKFSACRPEPPAPQKTPPVLARAPRTFP